MMNNEQATHRTLKIMNYEYFVKLTKYIIITQLMMNCQLMNIK